MWTFAPGEREREREKQQQQQQQRRLNPHAEAWPEKAVVQGTLDLLRKKKHYCPMFSFLQSLSLHH